MHDARRSARDLNREHEDDAMTGIHLGFHRNRVAAPAAERIYFAPKYRGASDPATPSDASSPRYAAIAAQSTPGALALRCTTHTAETST